jgi:hypothetical protein
MDLTDDPLAGIDAEELESDIDKAIDELFVKKGESQQPLVAEEAPAEEPVVELSEEPAPAPSAAAEVDFLGELKEKLLTLDWEITAENIQSFENELQAVSDKLGDDRHSGAVIKMALGVLQYLRAAKGSAAPISIQFLHAATRGLDIFVRDPGPSDAERNQVMDKLLGQFRRVKAEIQRVKPPAAEPPPPEEQVLEEIGADEPTVLAEPPEDELVLEELLEDEPLLEEFPEEEPTLVPPAAEEPTLEEIAADEPTVLAEPPEDEPVLEELLEDEPLLEEPPEEELPLEELLEEEPALEPTGIAFAPAAAPDEIPTSVQQLTQEVREQIGQLSNALEAVDQESRDFFDRLLQAMTGKPTLEKVERHFSIVYKAIEDKLNDAKESSGKIGAALTNLEQSLGRQQMGSLAPGDQPRIDSQVKIIQDAVERFTQAAADLRKNLTGRTLPATPGTEVEPLSDIGVDTEEFAFEPEEAMESLGAEPLLDLVDEIPPEAPGQAPSPAATIYLADVANNTLGIPTEAVVNVFKISKRRAKAFRKRGYARLADFKAVFRSIKRGITGPLADLKIKELKKIQFPIITLGPEILGSDDTQAEAPVKGIVLLSNGERHGALFTDETMQRTPYEVKGYRKAGIPGEVSGTAVIEGDFEINVIDSDQVLS